MTPTTTSPLTSSPQPANSLPALTQPGSPLTQPGSAPVTKPGAPSVKVPMMNLTFFVNHLGNDDFQLAHIPYKGNEVSMVIVLPRKKDGLAEVEPA